MADWVLLAALLAPLAAEPPPASGAGVGETSGVLLDRVVAMVDEEAILLSDLERVIALGLVPPRDGETDAALRRRVLDGLVDGRLRLREVERYGAPPVDPAVLEAQVEKVRARFPDPAAFARELDRLGLDEDGLRRLVGRQLRILAYVEERLAARVFVSVDDVKSYYDAELVPELRRRGEPPPPLAEVRGQIRDVLRERSLNEEIASWTAELRSRAQISDLLDRAPPALPALHRRLEPSADGG